MPVCHKDFYQLPILLVYTSSKINIKFSSTRGNDTIRQLLIDSVKLHFSICYNILFQCHYRLSQSCYPIELIWWSYHLIIFNLTQHYNSDAWSIHYHRRANETLQFNSKVDTAMIEVTPVPRWCSQRLPLNTFVSTTALSCWKECWGWCLQRRTDPSSRIFESIIHHR